MKILGWKYSEENNMKQQASEVVSSVSFYIQKIKHMSRFMPLKVRLVYANAMLMSRVKYGMFSFQGQTIEIKDMIFKTIIKSARFVKGNYCYKESIKSICESFSS